MSETDKPLVEVNKEELQAKALTIVDFLKNVAERHERTYPADIDAVLVFSGPGTYYQRLKDYQTDESRRWMDRDRIRAGVAVVREVTKARMLRDKIVDDKFYEPTK